MNLDSTAVARSSLFYVLVIALATSVSCSCPAAPSITSISPTSTTAGGDPVELTINGDNFLSTSTVDINGILTPSFVSSHQLIATIPAAATAQPGTLNVLVLNPPGSGSSPGSIGGGITTTSNSTCAGNNSNAVSFTVNPDSVSN
jgi:IPT/TIG domain